MKGSIIRYCACRDPETGKQLAARCPKLGDSKHGQFEYRDRLPTSKGTGTYRRRGFRTRKAASEYRNHVYELLALAKGDAYTLARIGDLIHGVMRGQDPPAVEDVRRRLGLGHTLDRSQTLGEWLETWYAAKKRARRDSTLRGYRQHLDHYLIPQLGDWPMDRLNALHISDLFDLIIEWNQEILAAHAEGRGPVLEGDVRKRAKIVGVATQHRIFATLRGALNVAMRQKPVRLLDFNPCDLVELEPEYREPAQVWDPEQVAAFLEYAEDDPLYLLFRLVLIHGPRRGEAVGARWAGYDHGAKLLRVQRPLLQLGGKLVESTPKTRAGERVLFLDDETNDGIKRLRVQQAKARLVWGAAYDDHDLIFCQEDGSPYSPDWVSRHFKDLARAAGLPPIKLHEGRHTSATLRLEAGVDVRVVSEQLGHSTSTITRDTYQHVRRAVLDQATEAVVRLLPERRKRGAEETG
jgi:integrase